MPLISLLKCLNSSHKPVAALYAISVKVPTSSLSFSSGTCPDHFIGIDVPSTKNTSESSCEISLNALTQFANSVSDKLFLVNVGYLPPTVRFSSVSPSTSRGSIRYRSVRSSSGLSNSGFFSPPLTWKLYVPSSFWLITKLGILSSPSSA